MYTKIKAIGVITTFYSGQLLEGISVYNEGLQNFLHIGHFTNWDSKMYKANV